jgi:hypothetical protein
MAKKPQNSAAVVNRFGRQIDASTPQLGVEQGLARLDFGHCAVVVWQAGEAG